MNVLLSVREFIYMEMHINTQFIKHMYKIHTLINTTRLLHKFCLCSPLLHTGASLPFQGTCLGMGDFIKQGITYYTHSQTGDTKNTTENTILLNPVLSQRFQQVSHIFQVLKTI